MKDWAAFLPLAAVLIDGIIGDPGFFWHPVVLIGRLIGLLEKILLWPQATAGRKKCAGLLLTVVTLLVTYGVVWLVLMMLSRLNPLIGKVGGALLLTFAISPRSLAKAGQEIRNCLISGDLSQARFKVSRIVGRDTAELDIAGITRATVETVAENIVDGIIAPLFYAYVGGVPLAFLYRAVNTLDSMVGYKNAKYADFGMVSAKVDDLFNYLPARITGLLLALAAAILGYDVRGTVSCIWRDAAKHPSPNSGIPEAGVAGALGIRLGGLNYYGGVESFRAYLGEPHKELAPVHITQTIRLLYLTTALFLLMASSLAMLARF